MTKKRKSLDDSLANDFVFGGDKPEAEAAPTPEIEEVKAVEKASTPIAPIALQL